MKRRLLAFLLALLLVFSCTSCLDGFLNQNTTESTPPVSSGASLEVHFIDVGQADAALVLCGGKVLMIDGGNREDGSLIYTYLHEHGITHIDYMVCTHAHEDHVGGLPSALSYATVGTVYSPVDKGTTKVFNNFVSKVESRGSKITIPTPGTSFLLGEARVTILGPLKDDYEDTNDTSIVLRVDFGKTSFLFTGDMESLAESDLVASGSNLAATVLKVGHHGSYSSTSYSFLKAVNPQYAVISLGKDNSYGHPHEAVMSRLRDADVTVYRTDMQGDIICTSDGESVSFTTSRNGNVQTNPTESQKTTSSDAAVGEYAYIGNLNTKTYHRADCASLPAEENRIYFTTVQEAESNGYTACKSCSPQ